MLIDYKCPIIANEAMNSLNGKIIENFLMDLEIAYSASLLLPLSPLHFSNPSGMNFAVNVSENTHKKISLKYTNSDIEIQIPVTEVNFDTQNTPVGSFSPFFPDPQNQSSVSSPQSQMTMFDLNINDSPISIHMIPNEVKFAEFIKKPEKVEKAKKTKKIKKNKIKANEDRNLMMLCDICSRNIKQKSFKAHIQTKVHQNNLRLNI